MFIEPDKNIEKKLPDWNRRKGFLPSLIRLYNFIKKGPSQVVIIGAGGVGKSILTRFLSGQSLIDTNLRDTPYSNYQVSIDISSAKLEGLLPGSLIDTPGQKVESVYALFDPDRDFVSRRNKGIINVVSYGYHSIQSLSYTDTKYYEKSMDVNKFMIKYQEKRRNLELKMISDLVPQLQPIKGTVWMITLVTKQDLWWDIRGEVKKHYTEGDYNNYIEDIKNMLGNNNFKHIYLSTSLVRSNLATDNGDVLMKSSKDYSRYIQNANLEFLLTTLKNYLTE